MKPPLRPPDEALRLKALRAYRWIDSLPEPEFDELTRMVARLCETPIAYISLIDEHRQWFKSKVGLTFSETPRDISFCGHRILQRDVFIVPDALLDERFADNPLVIEEPHIRFYACAPLISPQGLTIGTLSVGDCVPRVLSAVQLELLQVMSRQVMAQLELRRQAHELTESEARQRLALEAARVGTFDWNLLQGHLSWSQGHGVLWGFKPGEFDGTYEAFANRVHPEDLPAVKAESARCMAARVPFRREFRVVWPDGSVHWIDALAEFAFTPSGEAVRMRGVVLETTERKRAEQALRESEDWLRKSQHVARLGSYRFDAHTGTWISSSVLDEVFGIDAHFHKDVQGWLGLVHPEQRQEMLDHLTRHVLKERNRFDRQYRILRHNDGQERWVHGLGELDFDTDGRPSAMFGTIQDITERKRAEERLEISEERLRQAVRCAQIGIFDHNHLTGALYWSPELRSIYGWDAEVPVCLTDYITMVHPDDRESIAEAVRRAHGPGSDGLYDVEHRLIRHSDGELRWLATRSITVFEGEGTSRHPVRTVGAVRDFTDSKLAELSVQQSHQAYAALSDKQRRLEEQFRQAQKMEAIGQLAGGVAHDFNNILAVIMMRAEMTSAMNNLSDDAQDGLREIISAAERASNLTRQLLLFSRRQVMQTQHLDLNEIVTNLSKMLRRIIGEDVRLHLDLHAKPLMTRADPGMLDQVLLNLAVNARDAMPAGGSLSIQTSESTLDAEHARHHSDTEPGPYVCLSVADTGSGIPPNIMEHIFEPFFTTKEAGKGTGLGLATVFGIVKQHQGWVEVESEAGKGAIFHVFLPACTRAATEETGGQIVRRKPVGGTETILMAEDDQGVRMVTHATLERHGYHVLDAADGAAALQLWQEHREQVALLLTDLVMPGGMSGRDLARRLQTENPKLKVILTSGYSADIAGRQLELRDGENFLQKPCPPDRLLEMLRRCLDT